MTRSTKDIAASYARDYTVRQLEQLARLAGNMGDKRAVEIYEEAIRIKRGKQNAN